MARHAEAAESRWDEIDFEAKKWRIPAGRMKMKLEHNVHLYEQALMIQEAMKPISKHRAYVFPFTGIR